MFTRELLRKAMIFPTKAWKLEQSTVILLMQKIHNQELLDGTSICPFICIFLLKADINAIQIKRLGIVALTKHWYQNSFV